MEYSPAKAVCSIATVELPEAHSDYRCPSDGLRTTRKSFTVSIEWTAISSGFAQAAFSAPHLARLLLKNINRGDQATASVLPLPEVAK